MLKTIHEQTSAIVLENFKDMTRLGSEEKSQQFRDVLIAEIEREFGFTKDRNNARKVTISEVIECSNTASLINQLSNKTKDRNQLELTVLHS